MQLCYNVSSMGVINLVIGGAMLIWCHLVSGQARLPWGMGSTVPAHSRGAVGSFSKLLVAFSGRSVHLHGMRHLHRGAALNCQLAVQVWLIMLMRGLWRFYNFVVEVESDFVSELHPQSGCEADSEAKK